MDRRSGLVELLEPLIISNFSANAVEAEHANLAMLIILGNFHRKLAIGINACSEKGVIKT